jgi:hypothetical protein
MRQVNLVLKIMEMLAKRSVLNRLLVKYFIIFHFLLFYIKRMVLFTGLQAKIYL